MGTVPGHLKLEPGALFARRKNSKNTNPKPIIIITIITSIIITTIIAVIAS